MRHHSAPARAPRRVGLIASAILLALALGGAGAWWKLRETAGTLAGNDAAFDRTDPAGLQAARQGNGDATPSALPPDTAAAPFEALARDPEPSGDTVPVGLRAEDPLALPSLDTYRAEVAADPHGTPPSVMAFARHVARRHKLAEGDPAVRTALFEELGRCAETPEAALPSATRAFCLVRLETLTRAFPSEFEAAYENRFASLHREILGSDRPFFATAPQSGDKR